MEVFWDVFGFWIREDVVKIFLIFVIDVIGFMGDDIEVVVVVI